MYSVNKITGVDMRMFNKNFSKKPIIQMEVVAAENLLFVLTDNMIHVCDISRIENNFEFMHSSADTKGCTLFTMDVDTRKSTTGELATFIRIGCAIKRRIVFFFWKKDKLASLELAIELIDVPRAISWVNQTVCVGYKDEYVLYDVRLYTCEEKLNPIYYQLIYLCFLLDFMHSPEDAQIDTNLINNQPGAQHLPDTQ